MILNIVIILILANAVYSGIRRGLALQIFYSVGYLLSYWVARMNYQSLAPKLELLVPYPSATEDSSFVFFSSELGLQLDKAFYPAIAFLLIVFGGWLVTRFLGIFVYKLTFFPLVKQVNFIGGGLLSFMVTFVALFLILYVLSMVPLNFIQNLFRDSGLARFIVEHTPVFSKQIENWWITQMM